MRISPGRIDTGVYPTVSLHISTVCMVPYMEPKDFSENRPNAFWFHIWILTAISRAPFSYRLSI